MNAPLKSMLIPVINLIVYGNFWIGLAAASLFIQTSFLFDGVSLHHPAVYFFFFATALLYCIHRTFGIAKVLREHSLGRFKVMYAYRYHIYIYGVIFFVGALYYYLQLGMEAQWRLILPAIISLGYVLPVPFFDKRLRDVPLLKIFLICSVWAWTVSFFPYYLNEKVPTKGLVWLLFLEKFFFLLAITIPFDIRDMEIDRQVATIPVLFGVKRAEQIAVAALFISLGLVIVNGLTWYPSFLFYALLLSYAVTFFCLWLSFKKTNDLYFMGLLDGTMVVKGLLAIIFFQ